MKKIVFYHNGTTGMFNENGEQAGGKDVNVPWLALYFQHLKSLGLNPSDFEFHMPDGNSKATYVPEYDNYSIRRV